MQAHIELTTSQRVAITAITEKIALLQQEMAAVFRELGLDPGTPATVDGNRLYVFRTTVAPVTEAVAGVEPDAPAP